MENGMATDVSHLWGYAIEFGICDSIDSDGKKSQVYVIQLF